MKLFTKSIDNKLFAQFPKGGSLDGQKVIAKIFNPYGRGRWYIMNSDPEDPDYLWGIVELFDGEPEVGSFSRSELENLRVGAFKLGLERDLYFDPMDAMEVYRGLKMGNKFEEGGTLEDSTYLARMAEEYAEREYGKKAKPESTVVRASKLPNGKNYYTEITVFFTDGSKQTFEQKDFEEFFDVDDYAKGGETNSQNIGSPKLDMNDFIGKKLTIELGSSGTTQVWNQEDFKQKIGQVLLHNLYDTDFAYSEFTDIGGIYRKNVLNSVVLPLIEVDEINKTLNDFFKYGFTPYSSREKVLFFKLNSKDTRKWIDNWFETTKDNPPKVIKMDELKKEYYYFRLDYTGEKPYMLEQGGYMAKGGTLKVIKDADKNQGRLYYERFNGAIGSFAWRYDKNYNEGILYPLDDFDREFYSHLKLKESEMLFRYKTDNMLGMFFPLIKINLDKMLVYFLEDSDDDKNPTFDSRGTKLEYLAIEEFYYEVREFAKGGETSNNIYKHKYIPTMTFEVTDYTSKGVKGIQKDSKSLSAKERKEGKIVTYTTSELNDLFTKSNEFAKGGATFDDKVRAIKRNLVGKKVPKDYQDEYGKRYDKNEAEESARRIAGAMQRNYKK